MNCYSALTKEEAFTTPPVTLAKGFIKQVCASLVFKPAGIDCSLLHGNLCSGKGWVVAAAGASRWAFAALPRAASSRRQGAEPALLAGKSSWDCPHSILHRASPKGSGVSLLNHRILGSLRVEKAFKINNSNLGFSHSGILLSMMGYLLDGVLFWRVECCSHNVSWLHLFVQYFCLLFSYRYLGTW